MSESVLSIIEGLEELFANIKKPSHTKESVDSHISRVLINLWFDDLFDLELVRAESYNDLKIIKLTVEEFIRDYDNYNLTGVFTLLLPQFDKPGYKMKWLDKNPKNWEFYKIINQFYEPTLSVLKLTNNEEYRRLIKDGIINLFFRLTNYNNGSIVPLLDLLDLHTAKRLLTKATSSDTNILFNWKLACEGILFTLLNMDVKMPAQYFPALTALEKKDDLYQTLIDLEQAFTKRSTKSE